MINTRLIHYTEDNRYRSPFQTAFRPNFSAVHCLFTIHNAIEVSKVRGDRLFCCFLDLKSAYDCVDRALLWTVLGKLGVHGTMLRAIKSLYSNATYAMKIRGRTGSSQPSHTGLRQGCPLSPTLFGLFLDGLSLYLSSVCPQDGFCVSHECMLSHLLYADDITLVATSAQSLQTLIHATTTFARLWASKTAQTKHLLCASLQALSNSHGLAVIWS